MRFKTWFENLNRLYQSVVIGLFFMGLLGGALTIGWGFWTVMLDTRIRRHVDPLADMLEFSMKRTGQWAPYLEDRAVRERDAQIKLEVRPTARGNPWVNIIEN